MAKQILTSLCALFLSQSLMAIEEPKYRILEQSDSFELRAYSPMIVAETLVDGAMDDASSKGFRRIAGYIFGGNSTDQGEEQKISMTAPVTIEPKNTNISMTAPVTLKDEGGLWRVHFVMPSEYTIETLPSPDSSDVVLREVPAQNFAVIEFSGFASESKVASKTRELNEWLAKKDISTKGAPLLARYNPPWTLPFLRRNEVMLEY